MNDPVRSNSGIPMYPHFTLVSLLTLLALFLFATGF